MKLTITLIATAIFLTACGEPPPTCTENFFYQEIPGCSEKLAEWMKNNPDQVAAFEEEQMKKTVEVQKRMMEAIFPKAK